MSDPKSFSQMLYGGLLDRLEVILAVGTAASLLALNAGMTAASTGIMICLSGLAGVFFLNAYKPPAQVQEGDEKKDFIAMLSQTILPKILWISCSVGSIGILFYLLQLNGSREMLTIGASSCAAGVALFLVLSLVRANTTQPLVPVLYRAVPLLLITGYILYGLAS